MFMNMRRRQSSTHSKRPIIHGISIKEQLFDFLLALLALLVAHTVAMMYFERLSVGDAIWLTVTTATTVGYGDLSAETFGGRVSTVILIYLAGIAILAQVVATYFEFRQDVKYRKLKGNWSWNMKDHIVFIHCPHAGAEEYFYQAVTQLRTSSQKESDLPVIIVSSNFKDGLPDRLHRLDVVHVHSNVLDAEALACANIKEASTIVLMAEQEHHPRSDSLNFEMVDRLRDMGITIKIISEVVSDENRLRMKKAGADHVIRPVRAYPELLVRTILSPGSEQIIEDLFSSNGEECIRYPSAIQGKWGDIASLLIRHDVGIPLAYESAMGNIISSAPPEDEVDVSAVFILAREGNIKQHSEVSKQGKRI